MAPPGNRPDPGENGRGRRLAAEALVLFRQLGDQPGVAQTFTNLGNLAFSAGDYAGAISAHEACLKVCRETGEILREGLCRGNLALAAYRMKDYGRAREEALVHLRQMVEIDSKRNVILGLGLVGGSLGRLGAPEKAARLLGASLRLMAQPGLDLDPGDTDEILDYAVHVKAQLTAATYEAAWAEGQKMTLAQAVAYALDE